jgi:hypothetical protein
MFIRAVSPEPTKSKSINNVFEPLEANDNPNANVSEVFPSPGEGLVTANTRRLSAPADN